VDLRVDIRWLLERQAEILPKHPDVADYSGLVAAIARHRVEPPRIDYDPVDNAWRAAALLQTLVLLNPLPARNALYGALIALRYMASAGEPIDPSPDELTALTDAVIVQQVDVYAVAEQIRAWRIL
jgi:hypothetical protein